jgi:hypothetical protein
MPKSTNTCNSILGLIFNATTWTNMAINATSGPLTNLYLGLYNSTGPGLGDNQTTNETTYTNYVRVAVVRTSSGWTVSTNTASNYALTQFAQCGITGDTLTYVAIGTAASPSAGHVLYEGALNSSLAVSNGIQPQFAALALVVTES